MADLFIGLMSGTSLDGVDAVVVELSETTCKTLHTHSIPYPDDLRVHLLELHTSHDNELEQSAVIGNILARLYAKTVMELLDQAGLSTSEIQAIGCHGQTIRHRPDLGFTLQIGNPSLLAELTGITVIADFRNRDVAAGGQGAPLVPAFHRAVFGSTSINRAIINIGGIANITYLSSNGAVTGFDTGPGNMLMDAWIQQHLGKPYDASGKWADNGHLLDTLLQDLLNEPFFAETPPKSTGRDLFSLQWLETRLQSGYRPVDVQQTLLELSVRTIADAISRHCSDVKEIYLCGGGAYNAALVARLQQLVHPVKIALSNKLGIDASWVEAAAFAWLARQCLQQLPGNIPEVTGAHGLRILGAIYNR